MEEIVQSFFNAEIAQAAMPIVLAGLLNTVLLSLLVVPLGLIGGLILALLAQVKHPIVRWPLVLLILLFAGLPFAGVELGGFACIAVAFFLNTGAYYGEILRAGIESIPRGQTEAARSTGLSGLQTMAWVILPQAVRNVLPDLLSNTLEVVKLTSLGSVVAVPELLFQARQAEKIGGRTRTLIKRQPRWSGRIMVARRCLPISLLSCCSVACDCRAPAAVAQNLRRLTKLAVRPSPAACTRKVELKHSIRPSRFGPGVSLALPPGGRLEKSVPSNRGPPCPRIDTYFCRLTEPYLSQVYATAAP
jgi:polar amino acid transport system permease protein